MIKLWLGHIASQGKRQWTVDGPEGGQGGACEREGGMGGERRRNCPVRWQLGKRSAERLLGRLSVHAAM